MIDRASWVRELMKCEGTPFVHQGRVIGAGLDCPGPMILAARSLGLKAQDFDETGYAREPGGTLQPLLDKYLVRVEREALQLGDVVLNAFRMQQPRHVAYVVGWKYGDLLLLHACAIRGKCLVERIQYGKYYRYVQGYTVPGVE